MQNASKIFKLFVFMQSHTPYDFFFKRFSDICWVGSDKYQSTSLIWPVHVCLQGSYTYKIFGPNTAVYFSRKSANQGLNYCGNILYEGKQLCSDSIGLFCTFNYTTFLCVRCRLYPARKIEFAIISGSQIGNSHTDFTLIIPNNYDVLQKFDIF